MSGNENTLKDALPPESDPGVQVLPDATLVVVGGPLAGKVFPLHGGDVLIGRVREARIRIDEKAVSGRHARVMYREGGHVVVDLGSTNGTLLNGQRLAPHQPVEIAAGDALQVAETVLAYLPSGVNDAQEQTHYLAKVLPQVPPTSTALALGDAGSWGDAAILARLLSAQPPPFAEPPAPTLEERIDQVLRILQMLKRNWVPIFSALTVCALLGTLQVLVFPPPSEATFTIRITPSASDRELNQDREHREFYTGVEQGFMNDALIKRTWNATFGHPLSRELLEIVRTNKLKFEGREYMTYQATFKDQDAEQGLKFLKLHLKNFLDSEEAKTLHVAKKESDFFGEQKQRAERELLKIEAELKAFKDKHLAGLPGFVDEHVTSRETLLLRQADLAAQSAHAQAALQAAKARLAEAAPLAQQRVDRALPHEQRLTQIRQRLSELRARGFGDQHPEVANLINEQANVTKLAEEARSRQNSELDLNANAGLVDLRNRVRDAEVAARGAGAALGAVGGQIVRLDAILKKTPEVEARYAQLTRAHEAKQNEFKSFSDKLSAAETRLETERNSARARFQVLSPPQTTGFEFRKALYKGAVFGAVFGLLVGGAITALLELRRYLRELREKRVGTARPPTTEMAVAEWRPER